MSPAPVRMTLQGLAEGGRAGISPEPRPISFSVLAVGINGESRREIEGALKRADFACRFSPGSDGAFREISQDKSIGVVVIDPDAVCRPVSHLALELRQRAGRPVAIVLMVRELTIELTEVLLEAGAVGVLGFPMNPENIVRVVTTAANAYRSEVCRKESVATAFHIIKDALGGGDTAGCGTVFSNGQTSALLQRGTDFLAYRTEQKQPLQSNTPGLKSVKAVHGFFRDNGVVLDPVNVDNAAWLMLIDLFSIETEGRQIGVTALCTGVGVPVTTALKRLDELAAAGLVERKPDIVDRRRIFVCLTPKGRTSVLSMIERLEQTLTIAASAPEFSDGTRERDRPRPARAG